MENIAQPTSENATIKIPSQGGKAKVALTLGIIGMFVWIIPIIGLPVQITGLVFSVKSICSPKRGIAIAGLVLCVIGLVFTVANAAIGAYIGGMRAAQ